MTLPPEAIGIFLTMVFGPIFVGYQAYKRLCIRGGFPKLAGYGVWGIFVGLVYWKFSIPLIRAFVL